VRSVPAVAYHAGRTVTGYGRDSKKILSRTNLSATDTFVDSKSSQRLLRSRPASRPRSPMRYGSRSHLGIAPAPKVGQTTLVSLCMTENGMALRFWVTRPRIFAARLRYWVWAKLNPDKPWMCPGSIEFLQANLSRSMNVLEFVSGRSTHWFSTLVGNVTSVEHNAEWYAQVKQRLADAGVQNVDYRHIPLNHLPAEPERAEYTPHLTTSGCRQDARFRCRGRSLPHTLRRSRDPENCKGRLPVGWTTSTCGHLLARYLCGRQYERPQAMCDLASPMNNVAKTSSVRPL
jgi:hypothetical protein